DGHQACPIVAPAELGTLGLWQPRGKGYFTCRTEKWYGNAAGPTRPRPSPINLARETRCAAGNAYLGPRRVMAPSEPPLPSTKLFPWLLKVEPVPWTQPLALPVTADSATRIVAPVPVENTPILPLKLATEPITMRSVAAWPEADWTMKPLL